MASQVIDPGRTIQVSEPDMQRRMESRWRPPATIGSRNRNRHQAQTVPLHEMLAMSIILAEEFDKLSKPIQESLRQLPPTDELLSNLVRHGLLTEYQSARLEAGQVHGLILGSYRVLDRLGAGGMGVVFKAEHIEMRRKVAIKVMAMSSEIDSRLQRRFLTEIRVVAQLQHPNIVSAIDCGRLLGAENLVPTSLGDAPNLRYFVMEYVPGEDLDESVSAHGPMPVAKACDIIHQIASALAEAHQHNLVHRDIKPANIRVTPESHAKLLDFGLARNFDNRITEPGTIIGTLAFMAPEQMVDPSAVDIRADLYALGGTLFWCLTGAYPFESVGTMVEDVVARQSQSPPSLCAIRPELPIELETVISKMMATKPEDRYESPQLVMRALLPFLKPERHDAIGVDPSILSSSAITAGSNRLTRRLLIVDDEPELRRFTRMALESEGGPVCDEADDGLAALEAFRSRHYDLVLLDIDMPKMTGPDVCRALRENPPCQHLKIIMVSGRASADEMARMLLTGADDYLTKPFSVVALKSKVHSALRLKEAQDRADNLNSHLLAVNRELEQSLNARSSDLVQARNGLVRALAKLVETREGDAGSHLIRMEQYSRCLAEEAAQDPAFANQVDENFVDLLACCAPLHDIGKIGLPDHILLKSGKLEPDERILMQTHTTAGAETLRSVMAQSNSSLAFLQMAADIARHHHERFDGSGYPDQLVGSSIPLAARIVSICDVYDALRSRRSYKPALSHSAALQVMTRLSIGQFDPSLLLAFNRCSGRFEQIFKDHSNG